VLSPVVTRIRQLIGTFDNTGAVANARAQLASTAEAHAAVDRLEHRLIGAERVTARGAADQPSGRHEDVA
jgi:hypothetical protein